MTTQATPAVSTYRTAALVHSLNAYAKALADEALRIESFARSVEDEMTEAGDAGWQGTCLDSNVLSVLSRSMNTSNRISAFESAIREATNLTHKGA